MRVAFVTPAPPFPPNAGGRIVYYDRIRALAQLEHQIDLFSIIDRDEEVSAGAALQRICTSLRFYRRERCNIQCLWTPVSVGTRAIAALRSDLHDYVLSQNPCAVFFEHQMMGHYSTAVAPGASLRILSVHNNETRSLLESMRSSAFGVKKLAFALDATRMRAYEQRIFSRALFDVYIFLSRSEMNYYCKRFPSIQGRTHVISGFARDLQSADAAGIPEDGTRWLVFTGTMSYPPNVDAAVWFARDIFPAVSARFPDARFLIVGRDPDRRLHRLAERNPSICLTGSVPDTQPYLQRADVIVLPVRYGTGVKIKLLEALFAGKPVIATPAATEGLDAETVRHLSIARSAEDFANATIEVLQSPRRSQSVQDDAVAALSERHSSSHIGRQLESLWSETQPV